MLHSLSKLGLAALLGSLLVVPSLAWGQGGRARIVIDKAKLFSKDAVESANKVIKTLHDKHKKDLEIETTDQPIPVKEREEYTRKRFDELAVDGIYVLFIKDAAGISWRYRVGDKTQQN